MARAGPGIVATEDVTLVYAGPIGMSFEDVSYAERGAGVEELHIRRIEHHLGILGQDGHVEVEGRQHRGTGYARDRVAMGDIGGPKLLSNDLERDWIDRVILLRVNTHA